eukprot:gene13711-19605_t
MQVPARLGKALVFGQLAGPLWGSPLGKACWAAVGARLLGNVGQGPLFGQGGVGLLARHLGKGLVGHRSKP